MAELASQAKSEFMSQASHELRTPLNAVLGFSQIMRTDTEHPIEPKQTERLMHIEAAAQHLLVLIEDMLNFSRLENGTLPVNIQTTNVQTLVRRCAAMAQAVASARNIQIRIEGADIPLWALADPTRLEQVLHNLLSNAIKFNRPNGWVELRCLDEGEHVHIAVVDGGMGLSGAQQAKLFQPFNRLGRHHIEGSGMGLVISKQLVERMGGSISATGITDQGATFTIILRAARPAG